MFFIFPVGCTVQIILGIVYKLPEFYLASLGKIPLQNVLHISPGKVTTLIKDNVILKNTEYLPLIGKLEGYSNCFSLLTPIHEQPDIQLGFWA